MPKKPAGNRPPTKAKALDEIAVQSGCSKGDVVKVMDAMEAVMQRNVKKFGEFTIHGMLKVRKAHKNATKARMGRNPATGEPLQISAKPAKTVMRVTLLKRVKELA